MSKKKLDYHELIEPTLALLSKTDNYIYKDEISESLVDSLDCGVENLQEMLPSGRQTVFDSQLQWALSYLEQDRLIESDGASAFRITAVGRQFANGGSCEVQARNEPGAKFFQTPPMSDVPGMAEEPGKDVAKDALAVIAREFDAVYRDLKKQVLERIYSQSPAFFENLIIDLLLSMGYGDRRRDLVSHLGCSGDGGVDGAIRQDQLGLDVVYVQAKRYRPGLAVPVSAVRDFAGALEAHKANKGLFVTTSHFTRSGKAFIAAVSSRIVLIDGDRLSSLLIRNNVGVRIHETYEIKRIDEDFFKNA